MYVHLMFEWDPDKARSNLAKHGVSFELETRVWDDPLVEVMLNSVVDGEERWAAIGTVATLLLVVVHSSPEPTDDRNVRIISARKATPSERRRYEQQTL
jgi:uncharacterized DUF497 family protein